MKKTFLLYIPNPENHDHEEHIFPNGVIYLYASLLKNNISSEMLMLNPSDYNELIEEFKPGDIVCFSVNSSNRYVSFKMAKKIKTDISKIKIIFGGPFITLLDDETLKKIDYVDCFFKGEGEILFPDILKNNSPLKKIVYSDRIKDIDNITIPCTQGLIYSNIITSRGCPGECIYCSSPSLWKRKISFRSVSSIMDEILCLYNMGVDYFVFSDDTFTANKQRIISLCEKIIESDIKIIFDARSRTDYMDIDIIKMLAKAGCISISFGIESASQKIIEYFKKKIDIEKSIEIIDLCEKHGIRTNLFFITGSENENDEDIKKNQDFIKKTRPSWITSASLHYYPGTELYKKSKLNIDWINTSGTIYSKPPDITYINNQKLYKTHSKYKRKIDIKRLLKEIPDDYRNKFWVYHMAGELSQKNNEKIKYFSRALKLYESPEILFNMAQIKGGKYFDLSYNKFLFQFENNIRNNRTFLENAMYAFDYFNDKEKTKEIKITLDEIFH